MPGVLPTLGDNGPMPAIWNALIQQINGAATVAASSALQTSQQALDLYQNCCAIVGQLNQTVTIGAGWISGNPQQGVIIATGLTGWGVAYPSSFAHNTISLAAGSTAATLTSGTGFATNQYIGAVAAGTSPNTQALTAGTFISGLAGTAVTLSQNALLTGSFYCAAAAWTNLSTTVHP